MSAGHIPEGTHPERPWLSIVGVGADGTQGLSQNAQRAITHAELVLGSPRQLELVQTLIHGESVTWPSPLSQGITRLFERRGRSTCVLASGDPFFYGIGSTLAPQLRPGEFVCYPTPSSVSLAAARLGWALQDTEVVSLHGRDLHGVIRHLQPGRRLLLLSWNGRTPGELAEFLSARGFGPSILTVFEDLGGPRERRRSSAAEPFALTDVGDLNLIALEPRPGPRAFSLPCRTALPDAAFEHDGQLTKREIRSVTLSALEPHPGAYLWDVGAGSGSIGIEWMLSHPACRATAIEQDRARFERIVRNARALGAPELEVIHAAAPGGLTELSPPDAIFVGGGALERGLLEHCLEVLHAGGRLVVNAVSIETEARLLALHATHGGELFRLSIERAQPLGDLMCFRPALPVVQWRFTKP
jgi:precorrin-6Y C5,15-methyltransferase (decarboxylating)